MKLETLVTRYKNLGYTPKGLERDLEIESIIKWIYETYDIYIDVWYCNMNFDKHREQYDKTVSYLKFQGVATWNTKQEYNYRFTCEKYFDTPFDAKFDAVRKYYRAIKFQFH